MIDRRREVKRERGLLQRGELIERGHYRVEVYLELVGLIRRGGV